MKHWLLFIFFLFFYSDETVCQPAANEAEWQAVKKHFDKGEAYLNSRQFDSAEVVLKYSFNVAKQKLVPESRLTAEIAHALGYALMMQEQPTVALVYYLEALRIRQLIVTSPDAILAYTYNALGILFESAGDDENAEKHFLEARTQWAASLGKDHLRYGWAQHNLGRLYNKTGRHQEAVECLTDALRVKQLNLPSDDPDLGHSLVPLSLSHFELGDFAAYEASALRAIEIWKKQKGTNDLLYYWSLHNLANLQENLGNHDMAKSLAYEAVKGKAAIRGAQHLDVALSLITLAAIFSAEGQPDSAQLYFMKAKEIYATQAPHSMENAWVLNQLGLHSLSQGNYDQAVAFLTASLELKEKLIGTENTEYRSTLLHYARALIQMNQLDTAYQLLQQQKLFYEENNITQHANYVSCLDLLGYVQTERSDRRSAYHTYQVANQINREAAPLVSGISSESEFFRFLTSTKYYLDKYLSLSLHTLDMTETDIMNVSNHILWNRSFLLDKYTETRNQVRWDTSSLRLYTELTKQRKKWQVHQGRQLSGRMDVKDIELKIAALENEIARQVQFNTRPATNTEAIRNVLKTGEIAIEFFDYAYYMPAYRDSVFYGALLLFPGDVDPVLLTLFEARQLMQYVADTHRNQSDFANLIYIRHGNSLYDLIWKPLLPYLSNGRTIYFSTSGLLHRINFAALPLNQDHLVAEEYDLVRVITTGQLLIGPHKLSNNRTGALMGGIRYASDSTGQVPLENAEKTMAQAMYGLTEISNAEPSPRGEAWTYLRGSGEEIERIIPIMKKAGFDINSWKEDEATEEQFKNLGRTATREQSPRVIHLSTHGYFYPDPIQHTNATWQGGQRHLIQAADNPMIRSGLILAGGNYAWQYGKPLQPWMEDGILTADEISTMDLSDTELVVLSACETGLGDIEGNEGVYGLQRALKIAGVQHIMMSLWQVPDAATAELMQRFYMNWLTRKMTLRAALQHAQLEMHEEGFEPYEWAGFILIE